MTHPDTLTIPRAVVEQAIEALENAYSGSIQGYHETFDNLHAALQPQAAAEPVTDAPDLPEPVGVVLGFEDDSGMAMVDHASEGGPMLEEKQCVYSGDQMEQRWFQGFLAGKSHTTPPATQAEPVIPAGFALVPIRATPAMEEVFAEEGWEWANVLAAAEAVTEEEYEDAQAAAEPVAWMTKLGDVTCFDLVHPKSVNSVPLYTIPPATQAAPVSLQAAHDAVTIDTLNDRVMRQQAALTAALEALKSVPTAFGNMHDAEKVQDAIAQIEALKGPTP